MKLILILSLAAYAAGIAAASWGTGIGLGAW